MANQIKVEVAGWGFSKGVALPAFPPYSLPAWSVDVISGALAAILGHEAPEDGQHPSWTEEGP